MRVDRRYQKDFQKSWADTLAASMDLDGLGVTTVSRREDGSLWIVDGQHRNGALISLGLGGWEVTCNVYEGLDISQEAALYRLLNRHRRPSPWDDFKAGIVERDPECLEIVAICSEAGYRVSGSSGDGYVACITALREIYRRQDGSLAKSLKDARMAWGTVSSGVERDVLRGLSWVHATYGSEIDRSALVKKLAKTAGGPSHILATARALKEIRSEPIYRLVASAIVSIYNKGRRTGQLAPL